MLELLKINNVALIKNLEIDFSRGFNVILGETGAGKSIIIDALNFVLGDKADKTLIRAGEEMMKVTAKFSTQNNTVLNLLQNFAIDAGEEILLTRTCSQSGKGDVRINGELASISMLKELGSALVDAYSQNESVALLKQKNHLAILDSYKPFELKEIKEKIERQIEELNRINKEIKEFGGSQANRERQIDMLKFQITEIEQSNIQPNEDEEIAQTLTKLSNSEKILSNLSTANSALSDEQSGVDLIKSAVRALSNIENYDEKISKIHQRLSSLSLDLEDISETLYSLGEEYNFDENALDRLIERRDKLDNLKKKYGGTLENVKAFLENANIELDKLENAEILLKNKEEEKKNLLEKTLKNMTLLSEIRKGHAQEIEKKIESGLAEVGIPKAKFKIKFFPLTNSIFELSSYNLNCLEDVEFLFSANFGEELKPLARTISGGEMTRFMLIFKNVIAEVGGSETLIFDEVDAGISGQTANAVALKIAKLSKQYQIICITHLAQVASMGDCFYYVSKKQIGDRTETQIAMLPQDKIAEELALLSYGKIDESRILLASEMFKQNAEIKKEL